MAVRYLVPATSLLLSALLSGTIYAIGLDEIRQQSGLGEPLRLVIPIIANAADQISGDDLAGECFKVVAPTANDVPQLNAARVTLERRGAQAFVVLTTAYPIQEPIMRVAVQAGCRMSVSREYTVLFDPVSIEPPAVQVAAATVQESRPAGRASETAVEAPAPALAATPPRARPRPQMQQAPNRVATAPRAKPTTGTGTTSVNVATGVITQTPRAPKPSSGPRLQISRTIDDAAGAPSTTKPKSVAEREALMALEEHTVVLQRQIAELATQMERLDAELRAARAAQAAAEKAAAVATQAAAAAPTAATTSWWSTLRTWLADNWPSLVLVPLIVGLVVALVTRRRAERPVVPRPMTATQAASFNAADLGEPSVPGPEEKPDREAVVPSIKDRPRGHMIPPVFAEPIEPDQPAKAAAATHYDYDPGISVSDMQADDTNFDEEVRKAYEVASEYSVLEREEPGIVARLVDGWGTPRTTAQLENILLTPRRSGRPLSTGAIEELKLLRLVAMERVADLDSTMQRWIGNPRTPPGAIAGTH
jgi:hypothetical protein